MTTTTLLPVPRMMINDAGKRVKMPTIPESLREAAELQQDMLPLMLNRRQGSPTFRHAYNAILHATYASIACTNYPDEQGAPLHEMRSARLDADRARAAAAAEATTTAGR